MDKAKIINISCFSLKDFFCSLFLCFWNYSHRLSVNLKLPNSVSYILLWIRKYSFDLKKQSVYFLLVHILCWIKISIPRAIRIKKVFLNILASVSPNIPTIPFYRFVWIMHYQIPLHRKYKSVINTMFIIKYYYMVNKFRCLKKHFFIFRKPLYNTFCAIVSKTGIYEYSYDSHSFICQISIDFLTVLRLRALYLNHEKIYCNGSGTRSLICKLRQIGYYIQDENRSILINFTSIAFTSGVFLKFEIFLWKIQETFCLNFLFFIHPNSKALLNKPSRAEHKN